MKKFLLANSTNAIEYASILAAESWLSGILSRSQNKYLDLVEPSEDECVCFLTKFVEDCSSVLQVHEGLSKLYGKELSLTISHIDEFTSSEVIANAARKANINLKNIPTYSYTKFYLLRDKTVWVDINTNDENKREAYSIKKESRGFDVKKYEPEPGVELPEYLSKLDSSLEFTM